MATRVQTTYPGPNLVFRGGGQVWAHPHGGVGNDPDDKLYSRAAYNTVSDDQTYALRQKLLDHGHVRTKKRGKQEQENTGYHTHISVLTVRLDALETADPDDDDAEAKGNRSNKALLRQKK
jgi:hypothetical protein